MSEHTYGTYWLYDQAHALLIKYLRREISSNDFASQFIDLKSKAQQMEFENIHDAWKQGYFDAEDKTRLIKAGKLHDFFEKYKHNYE
jgi:hypothetical protein